jgi:hypothetical protein
MQKRNNLAHPPGCAGNVSAEEPKTPGLKREELDFDLKPG